MSITVLGRYLPTTPLCYFPRIPSGRIMSTQPAPHPNLDTETARESLRLHARQASGSRVSIWVLFSLIMVAVHQAIPAWRALGWGLPMLAVAQYIHVQCLFILERVDSADAEELRQLHGRMLRTTVTHQALMGTTVWWFGLQHEFELALVGTALQLIYTGAAMANGAVNVRTFIIGTWVNLGAAMAYWFLLETHRWPVGLALLGAAFVMSKMSKNMAEGFKDSLRMRFENNELLKRLAEEKRVAEEATAFKSRFLANVSHEIRTPVSAILGMCYLTLKTELTAKQRHYVQIVLQSSEHLSKLLNQVLDFSKIEASMLTLDRDPFSLKQMLEQVHAQHGALAHAKNLTLSLAVDGDVPPIVVGDALRLREILTNYVSNAIKFTPSGSIDVHVSLKNRTNAGVELKFDVKDTGIGLDAKQIGYVFDSFQQADASTTREYGGTGLGLAIAKNLAEMMNGAVGVISAPGQGSTFWFTAQFDLPTTDTPEKSEETAAILLTTHPPFKAAQSAPALSDADLAVARQAAAELSRLVAASDPAALSKLGQHADLLRALWPHAFAGIDAAIRQFDWDAAENLLAEQGCMPEKSDAAPQIHPLTVLTVDDNPVNITLMVDLLTPHYNVRAASSGQRALHIAQTQHIDLVLLDVMMPVMDGYEVCKRLQALPTMTACPILFLTAKNQIEDMEYGLQLGAQDYIAKPISPPLVLKRIETHLTLRALKAGAEPSHDCAPTASPCRASDLPD